MFFGADKGPEEVEFRTQKYKRGVAATAAACRENARCPPEPFLAYALNGEPLTKHQGAPLRLIVPGWYGVPNVKWLSQIHAQEDQYLGKYQARWYRTLKGEMIDGEMKWVETAITHLQLKSFVARVTKNGNRTRCWTVVLNDGTPLKIGRGESGRRSVAGGDDGSVDHGEVRLEALSTTRGMARRLANTHWSRV